MIKGLFYLSLSRHHLNFNLALHRCSIRRCITSMASPVRYNFIEYIEDLGRYKSGGYHPVHLGDQFYNRYRAIHKLGHGTYSTTWLARDQKINKLVAVKIGTADSNPREADILSTLNATAKGGAPTRDRQDDFFPPILDRFEIRGVNGIHPCYVTLPARASLSDAKEGSYTRLFQLNVARALAAQLALSVACLHHQGFVHGGTFLDSLTI